MTFSSQISRIRESVRAARVGLQRAEKRLGPIAARTPVLRVAHRLGWDRLLRTVGLAFWLGALLLEPLFWRPDLLHPTDIGSDSSNYAAATERLVAGHDLYKLVAGDRPTPADNPPEWIVPILSPPPIATVNLWQAMVPEAVGMYVTWATGLAAMAALGLIVIAAAPPVFVLLLLYLAPGFAVTAWSGNVNALIAPAVALMWWATRKRDARWQAVAGVIVAIAACVKIGPLFLAVWLVAQRRWIAVAACAAASLVIAVATVLMAGFDVIGEYLDVARSSVAVPSHLSIPGFLRDLGANGTVQTMGLAVVLVLMVAGIFYLRRSPVSFLAAVLAMIFSTTVVRAETVAMVISAAVAWIPISSRYPPGSGLPARWTIVTAFVPVAGLAAIAVAVSLATGGGDRSSIAITNRTSQPVVIRFNLVAQTASFGFLAPANVPVYAWLDRSGGSPSVASVWSSNCQLLDVISVSRTGAVIEIDDGGAHQDDEPPASANFANYVPSCAKELMEYVKAP